MECVEHVHAYGSMQNVGNLCMDGCNTRIVEISLAIKNPRISTHQNGAKVFAKVTKFTVLQDMLM